MQLYVSILETLKEFNAADWLKENSLGQFFLNFDIQIFDSLKDTLMNRVAECKEIVDRKNRGQFTADVLKVVDDEFIKDVRDEAGVLRHLCHRIEDLKLEYLVR